MAVSQLTDADRAQIAQMMAEAFKQAKKADKKPEPSIGEKVWSWCKGVPMPIAIPTVITTGATVAVGTAVYNWWPVQQLMSWGVIPSVKAGAALASLAGLSVPMPIQALAAWQGYEGLKAAASGEASSINIKKAAIYSLLLVAAAQDEGIRSFVTGLLTPTVTGTAAFCAAVDYADLVAKEGQWIPASVENSVSQGANYVSNHPATAAAFSTAASVAAYAKGYLGVAVSAGNALDDLDKRA